MAHTGVNRRSEKRSIIAAQQSKDSIIINYNGQSFFCLKMNVNPIHAINRSHKGNQFQT